MSKAARGFLPRLLWVLPAALTVGLMVLDIPSGLSLSIHLVLLLVSLGLAGALGGMVAGTVAGLLSAAMLYYCHVYGSGPDQLIHETEHAVTAGAAFILGTAAIGYATDQRELATARQLQKEVELELTLQRERAKGRQRIAQVAESASHLEMAVRISAIGHYTWNWQSGDCGFCSEQHAAHFGRTPEEFCKLTLGKEPYLDYVHEDDRAHVLESINRVNQGEALFFEYRSVRPSGEVRFVRQIEEPLFNEAGEQTGVSGASIDLTDLREAEARIRQSQRIEAIGTLTGGVAHDFNNLLAIIHGNLELAQGNEDAEVREQLIGQAITATQRGAGLTRNLLSFSRRAHLNPTRLNLNQLVNNTMRWSRRVLPATISIDNSLAAGLWDTELDTTSAENAIINILLNGRDAMPDGGSVTIKTANMRIDEEFVEVRQQEIKPGRYVMLAISDTGHGIEAEQLEKVFEPFFTNKPVGQGSGLGLSMVQGFINQSGGAIRVSSEIGVGTTIKLFFKAAEREDPAVLGIDETPVRDIETKNSRILLAEDEDGVRRILQMMLESAGYSVVAASSGDKALELFKSQRNFDLLITDVVMPGLLQGPVLAEEIRGLKPEVNCVFLSGYAAETIGQGAGLRPSDISMMKPFKREDFLAAVSTSLGSRESDSVTDQ